MILSNIDNIGDILGCFAHNCRFFFLSITSLLVKYQRYFTNISQLFHPCVEHAKMINSTFIRKFMLRLIVSNGDDNAYVTIFDASLYLIRCGVMVYFKDLQVSYTHIIFILFHVIQY